MNSLTTITKPGALAPNLERLRVDPDQLRANMERFAKNVRAKGTRATYAAQWRLFGEWCAVNGAQPVPATPAAVSAYISHLFDVGKSRSTIDVAVASIKDAHMEAGATDPFADAGVKRLMQGVVRTLVETGRTRPRVKKTISQDDLRALAAAAGDTLIGMRNRALVLVGYAGWCRRSEPLKLRAENIEWSDTSAQCWLGATKTDQTGEAGEYITVPRVADESICGYRALRRWLDAAAIQHGPVFVHVKRGVVGEQPITRESYINEIVEMLAQRAGLNPARIGPHRTFRASPITAAVRKGVPAAAVSQRARHKSFETTKKYIEANPADNEATGRAVYE